MKINFGSKIQWLYFLNCYIVPAEIICIKNTVSNINIILLIWRVFFFTPSLADGFQLEFEWQQVSAIHQDSF